MDKTISYLRTLFHILILFLIILSLYPGNILGFIFYGDLSKEIIITRNYLNISSNHLYVYFLVSIIGFYSYLEDKKLKLIIIFMLFLSVILELFHLIIPERSFQIIDLKGNIVGVLLAYIIILIYKFRKK